LLLKGCRKGILNDVLHLNNRRLPFLERLTLENGIVEVEVKVMPKPILKAKILLIFSIEVAALEGSDVTKIMAEVHGMRRSPATKVGSNIWTTHHMSRSIKGNKTSDRTLRAIVWCDQHAHALLLQHQPQHHDQWDQEPNEKM